MDANSQYELYLIERELQSIINELEDIAQGLRNDFSNIGNEQAATCVLKVAEKYARARHKLDNIDTKRVTAEFTAAHGGGGSVF